MILSIIKNDICFRKYKDFTIVYDLRNKSLVRLDAVAEEIFLFLAKNGSTTERTISSHVALLYEYNPEDIVNDVLEFVNELYELGLVQINGKYPVQKQEPSTIENEDYEGDIIQLLQSQDQLYSATLEMTYSCNEHCVHCYAHIPEDNSIIEEALSLDQYKSIIDDLYALNCMHIAFTGGDPFVYKDFFDVYKYAREKQFVCDIFTNGLALANDTVLLKEIVLLRPRAFYISIYGACAKTHDSITQVKGSFNKTIDVVRKLKAMGVSVVFNVMLLTTNYSELEAILSLAKQLEVEYRISMSIIYRNDGSDSPMQYFLNDEELIKHCLSLAQGNLYTLDKSIDQNYRGQFLCSAGITSLSINPKGDVFPCVSLKNSLGNVLITPLTDIWNKKERKAMRELLLWQNATECNNCVYINDCPHCVGISQAETGSIYSCNTCDRLLAKSISELKRKK